MQIWNATVCGDEFRDLAYTGHTHPEHYVEDPSFDKNQEGTASLLGPVDNQYLALQ